MTDMNTGSPSDIPDSRKLLRSTTIAAVVALLLLVTTVLPAEYGVDPTGVGRVLGLKQMGDIKVALAKEAAASDSAEAAARSQNAAPPAVETSSTIPPVAAAPVALPSEAPLLADTASHVTVVALQPDEGKEVKLAMRKGGRATFAWSTDRGVVNYDLHGDSTNAPNSYHNYKKGSGVASDDGALIAAFDGKHGWFWRNRTRQVVTITLRTSGDYQTVVRMD